MEETLFSRKVSAAFSPAQLIEMWLKVVNNLTKLELCQFSNKLYQSYLAPTMTTTPYILGSTITSNEGLLLDSLVNDGEEDGYKDSSLCVIVSFAG